MDKDLEQLVAASNYRFSATKIDKLGASDYTLATIVVDTSSSVSDFSAQLEQAIKTVFKACEKSDRKENLMLRVTHFNDSLHEIHGFKLLGSIKEDDYTACLQIGGMTALFDAIDEAIQATAMYGEKIVMSDYNANAIIVVVTDGQNNRGRVSHASEIKHAVEKTRKAEKLESLTVILVGVTNDDNNLDTYLTAVRDEGGIDQYISIGKASPGKIAKLAAFVSQSISSTSQALGTGQPSKPIKPQF